MGSDKGPEDNFLTYVWNERRLLRDDVFFLPLSMHMKRREQSRWPIGMWSLQDLATGQFFSQGLSSL